jgi:hypothetical protein
VTEYYATGIGDYACSVSDRTLQAPMGGNRFLYQQVTASVIECNRHDVICSSSIRECRYKKGQLMCESRFQGQSKRQQD